MQTALLDSFAILPLAASLLAQGITGFFIFRIAKTNPEKFPDPIFVKLSAFFVGVLGIGSILAIFLPNLLTYSIAIFVASVILLVIFILFNSFTPEIVEEFIPVAPAAEAEVAVDDPLIAIGQDFLSHVADSMAGEINLVRLLDFINETLMKNTGSDGGVVFLADDFEDIITSKSFAGKFPPPYKLPADLPHKPVRVETNFRYAQFNLGETVFGEVAASGKPLLITDGVQDSRVIVNGPEDFLKPGSYIVVPLMVKDRVVGVSGIARIPEHKPFGEEEFRVAKAIALYAGSAINNVYGVQEILEHADLEREASIASKIQKTLHPKRLPDLPEVGFGSFFNATKGVCGDYYDIILARRDRIAVAIADVAGKGIQSCMVMIMLRSVLHLVTNTTKSAGTILDWVNKGITGKIDMDHYATLAFLSYCAADHTIEYASAGHQPLIHFKASTGKIEVLHQKTDPIGVERSSVYEDMKLTVGQGDIIILYTDGLIEALNQEGKQYGLESLTKVVSESKSMTAKEIATEVKHNIQSFVGSASLHDDQTLVVMKIKA
jgi:sigma-B regulation protein RsbU (phosphoserine phosphatase)